MTRCCWTRRWRRCESGPLPKGWRSAGTVGVKLPVFWSTFLVKSCLKYWKIFWVCEEPLKFLLILVWLFVLTGNILNYLFIFISADTANGSTPLNSKPKENGDEENGKWTHKEKWLTGAVAILFVFLCICVAVLIYQHWFIVNKIKDVSKGLSY